MSRRTPRKRAESRARYYIREQAAKREWNTNHVDAGGQFLEENEIIAHFPDIGLGLEKPDFLVCLAGDPVMVVEAKNEANKINDAIEQAIGYADQINLTGKYHVKIAVGAAGEEDTGFTVVVHYLTPKGWGPLQSKGVELTTIPSLREAELALSSNTGTTTVTVPASHEFIDAAIELSVLLRKAKIEAWLRPRVIGSLVAAMYQGTVDTIPEKALASINTLMETTINAASDISQNKKAALVDALKLSGADFDRLAPSIGRVVSILRRLNVRSVLQTDTDFLGMFYEAFLRYGYDNNALGIVFTPRHITRFCVELTGAGLRDRVIDLASGTGGFLVAAFDAMLLQAKSPAAVDKVKASLYGFDTNPTVWALASLNMFFRGDGKSHMELGSSLEAKSRADVKGKFTRAYLNPPFSQEGEPERDFLTASMNALEPEGLLAAVVAAGIFADEIHAKWRTEFVRNHTLIAMISLPEDLFYPTSAPTSIIIAKAHLPQPDEQPVMMAKIWNDGYDKLKGRRIERAGSQLAEVRNVYECIKAGKPFSSPLALTIWGKEIKNGADWSPQQHLTQPPLSNEQAKTLQTLVKKSIFQAVAQMPELGEEVQNDFIQKWMELPELPTEAHETVDHFFTVENGKSAGERNYMDGSLAYVSSGDTSNSIVRLVGGIQEQIIESGAITVTAFGTACVQPWPFMARGNGGSAVRVLKPRFNMSLREMVWFAAQINAQRWRFFYARMAIKSRLERLVISSPPERLPDTGVPIAENIRAFKDSFNTYSSIE